MSETPPLTLHVMPPSHPCMTARKALGLKGLEYELVEYMPGSQIEAMEAVYGEGNTTVPGMLVGEEPVHGSREILARLEQLAPDPPLYPEPIADDVREAERWGDEELQDLGRRLPWGALAFRPESLGTFGGGGPLDPAGVDFAMRLIRATWKYHKMSAEIIAADLEGLPAKLDHADRLIADGIMGREAPNAADLQIAPTIRVLLVVADLHPVIAGRPCEELAHRLFPDYQGMVPAGAYPAGWVPRPTAPA
jgi:glutathione S-transferase